MQIDKKSIRIEEKNGTRLLVVCLGGGVVGDVGAFVAACYGRGRDYIQLPTTLLGQVDCGIGGNAPLFSDAEKPLRQG